MPQVVKVRSVNRNGSLVLSLAAELARALDVEAGDDAQIRVLGPGRLEVVFRKRV